MSAVKKLTKILNQRFAEKQTELPRLPAVMGNTTGGLVDDNKDGNVYVTIGDKVMSVFNNRVPNQIGTKVWVGLPTEETKNNKQWQVLSTRSVSPNGVVPGFSGYAPAKRYEWHATGGGQDPLAVHMRAFTPLKLSVSETVPESIEVYVNLYRGFVYTGTGYVAIARQDIDIQPHIPASVGQAAFVLVTIDNTGAVITTKGSEVAIAVLAIADLPAIPSNTVFICGAIRVYGGQFKVQEGRTNTDFVDLRFPGRAGVINWADIVGKPAVFVPDTSYTDVLYPLKWYKAAPPTVTDDDVAGYSKLDLWLDGFSGVSYINIDNTTGAAVWLAINAVDGGTGDIVFPIDGTLAVTTGAAVSFLVTKDITINFWYIMAMELGTASSTIVDVNKNGTTIFTTQANRPTLAFNDGNGWAVSGTPDFVDFVEGDIISIDIDQIATGAGRLVVVGQSAASAGGSGLVVTDGSTSVSNVGQITVDNVVDSGGGQVIISFNPPDYILVRDEKAAGTDGGTFTSGSFQTRTINTEVSDTGGHCSISANQITLAAGTYECRIEAPAYFCNQHTAVLYNISDTVNELIGSAARAGASGDSDMAPSIIVGKFTIASSKIFEVRHRCETTRASDGFGNASNFGVVEIYTIAEFHKVA